MKIGIDFDGTIADTNTAKSYWIKKNIGLSIPPYQCDKTTCLQYIKKEDYKIMG